MTVVFLVVQIPVFNSILYIYIYININIELFLGFALPDFELSHCNAVTLKFVDKIGGHLVIRSIVIKEIENARIRKVI